MLIVALTSPKAAVLTASFTCGESLGMRLILTYMHVCTEFINLSVPYCFLQAVTAGYFYHTARLSKGGVYKTVKHQQVSNTTSTTPCKVHTILFL